MENHSCCFFGHSNAPIGIKSKLNEVITDLIQNYDVRYFYVGTHGSFDSMAYSELCKIREIYPHIKISVVLAYIPIKGASNPDSVIPDGIEIVPKRFAIDYRNKWMLKQCNYVVAYVNRCFGGAAKYTSIAEKKNKKIINLGNF